jgi:serine/threonine protein kinase
MTLLSGSRFGSYDILHPLGAGGMGQVFAATDTRLGRKVALKILPPESMERPDRVRRFEQEARAASALNHPNILTVYEIGELDGIHYMATEYVEGHTIRGLIKASVSLNKALDIAVQAAAALTVAHNNGIVHRDIKPENIMVRPDGYVKILDFGLAKLTEAHTQAGLPSNDDPTIASALTRPGPVIGTFRYMSPEQARGLDVDARTDIWSFGTVLYEMVTGTAPFAAPTATDTLARILERQPTPVTEVGGVPPELQRILNRALAKNRNERYQNMRDFELDLRQLRKSQELSLEQVSQIKTADVAPADTSGRRPLVMGILSVAILAVVVLVWWGRHSGHRAAVPAPLPQRELTYRLHAQKLRAGKPFGDEFLAPAQQVFDSNWRIRLDFVSPQAGSLYVFDKEQDPTGATELSLFFPLPGTNSGLAQVGANQRVASDWARFEQRPGTEEFWIIWSASPLSDLEDTVRAVSNPQQMGIIHDPRRIAAIETLFAKFEVPSPDLILDKDLTQTTARNHGDVLAGDLKLEHR